MKVAVYTLTRDRVEYTAHCLPLLHCKAGYPFEHYIIDNGSEDGTVAWLKGEGRALFQSVTFLANNMGIAVAANLAKKQIGSTADLIVKFDNDCAVVTEGLLRSIVQFYRNAGSAWCQYVVSPRVTGINTKVPRLSVSKLHGSLFGRTRIVGGICHVVPAPLYQRYRYNEALPKARGNDGHFCRWLVAQGITIGYLEDLEVQHYKTTDGQAKQYPEYFRRKMKEEGR